MTGRPDAATPPEGGDRTTSDANRSHRDSNAVEYRCADGRPCTEVVDRLRAADRSHREGFDEIADELRRKAEAWARRHAYGMGATS